MPSEERKYRANIMGCVSSHLGLRRSNNEDNFLVNGAMNEHSVQIIDVCQSKQVSICGWTCFAVFDGMGGGEYGELAALLAAKEFQRIVFNDAFEYNDIDRLIRTAFLDANRRIIERQEHCAMYGTTGTVVCTNGTHFKVYHLGDSRAYLFRDNMLFQLTRDQTLAAMKVSAGIYDADDPQVEYEKHQLTEYIGCDVTKERLKPLESQWLAFQPGDQLLLCSDGLYDMCTDMEICEILRRFSKPKELLQQLIGQALENGGEDNITCLVIGLDI